MDRVLILTVLVSVGLFWTLKNRDNLTFTKFGEILVGIFVFSTCFARFGLPIYDMAVPTSYGPFGMAIRFELYLLFIPFLLWISANYHNWHLPKISRWVVFFIIYYILLCVLNPYNNIIISSLVAMFFLLSYMLFVYLLIKIGRAHV